MDNSRPAAACRMPPHPPRLHLHSLALVSHQLAFSPRPLPRSSGAVSRLRRAAAPHRVAGDKAGRAWTVSRVRRRSDYQSHAVRAVHVNLYQHDANQDAAARARAVEQYAA